MNLTRFALLFFIYASFIAVQAQANLQCVDLFSAKTYKTTEFTIHISGKKQSDRYLTKAHEILVANSDPAVAFMILDRISEFGVKSLTGEQRQFIFKFRQNSSFMRSIFQTSDQKHLSPAKFARFVKDFGVLKDMLLIEQDAQAEAIAAHILKKYEDLDFQKLLKKSEPASKKSVALYFIGIVQHTKEIMRKSIMTVDEVHDVRKHLRDVLRFLQMEQQIREEDGLENLESLNRAVVFLRKTNASLGEVCDGYAARMLSDEALGNPFPLTKKTLVQFPIEIRPRVEHFLNFYHLEVGD